MANWYFDFNATAPTGVRARSAMVEAMDSGWQNASSLYRGAGAVRRRLEDARECVAEGMGCDEGRVVFTSGATEGNNAVMMSEGMRAAGKRTVVISAVEHPCVRAAARKWFGKDRVVEIGVDTEGRVDVEALSGAIEGGGVGLVSVMAANNETGVLQPWREIAAICRAAGVRYHCDAAQWVGKMGAEGLGVCDYVTVSGHKMGAAKGCGFLVVAEDGEFEGAVGGPQENGMRAGTENWPAVASMVAALAETGERPAVGRARFEGLLEDVVPGVRVIGGGERLWNTAMVLVPEHKNLKWLTRLDGLGFQVSTGSACSAGKGNPSHVMEAMGLSYEEMGRVVRVSGGWETAIADWEALAGAFGEVWGVLEAGGKRGGGLDLANL